MTQHGSELRKVGCIGHQLGSKAKNGRLITSNEGEYYAPLYEHREFQFTEAMCWKTAEGRIQMPLKVGPFVISILRVGLLFILVTEALGSVHN